MFANVYLYIPISIRMCQILFIHMYIRTYVCMDVNTSMYVCMYVHMCVCVHVFIIYLYVYDNLWQLTLFYSLYVYVSPRIDHWDVERERIVFVTKINFFSIRYDFISQVVSEIRTVPLVLVDELVYGPITYPRFSVAQLVVFGCFLM